MASRDDGEARRGRNSHQKPHIDASETRAFIESGYGPWEEYVLRRWTVDRRDLGDQGEGPKPANDLPEYSKARKLICLDMSLMSASRVGHVLTHLQHFGSTEPGPRSAPGARRSSFRGAAVDVLLDFYEVFEPSLLLALKKAFGLRTNVQAWNEKRRVPEVADFEGNFFDAAVSMWAALPLWKKPVMSAALRELFVLEDPTGLQVVLGMIKESTRHCNAGRVDVWTRMLQRIGAHEAPNAANIDRAPTSSADTDGELTQRRQDARKKLWEETLLFADEWKGKALETVFNEPTKMYYVALDESDLRDNVDVHGSSVYIAILLSTLGVRCPRQPFLLDMPISCVSFLDCLDSEQVQVLWRPENFGKAFHLLRECSTPRVCSYVVNHYSNFIFNGRQPWQIANNAIDPNGLPERRAKLQPYLEQFAWYFCQDFLVPQLTQRLLGRDDTRCALQVVLNEFAEHGEPHRGDDFFEDAEDVRFWLWDLEVLPAKFRIERAVPLLQFANLLRRDLEKV